MDNKVVLANIHNRFKSLTRKYVLVSEQELLESGWAGPLPTISFTKLENYWVRLERTLGKYKVVKVEDWMLTQKSETPVDSNAPLPVSGKGRINLKEMYKNQIKEQNTPKDGKQ